MSFSSVHDFVQQNAIPFNSDNPGPAIDRFLMSCSSDLQLFALGEALHGSEDILRLRNRVFQHLVEQDDFRAIAIEASFPHARAMNEYVVNGTGSYDELQASAISHGWGKYAATRELIEWMRGYNADPKHEVKLHFYGFDLPAEGMGPTSPGSTLRHALDHLETLDAAAAAKHQEKIDSLLGADSRWQNPMLWRDPEQRKPLVEAASALRVESQKLLAALNKHRANFPSTVERLAHEEAAHYAKLARHHLSFFIALSDGDDWGPSLGARDALQADNLEYIVERERSRGRVFVFAHNKHFQKSKAAWELEGKLITWMPAGAHLAQTMGAAYAAIGTALAAPGSDAIEGMLRANVLLPTRGAPAVPPEVPMRRALESNPTYFPLTATAFSDFDAIVFLDGKA